MVRGLTQTPKPFQIGSARGPFAIDIRTKKRRTVGSQLSHNIFRAKFDCAPPSLSCYVTISRIQRDYNPRRIESSYQLLEKRQVQFSLAEHRTADDDLFRLPPGDLYRSRQGPNSAADPDLHPVRRPSRQAQFLHQLSVGSF